MHYIVVQKQEENFPIMICHPLTIDTLCKYIVSPSTEISKLNGLKGGRPQAPPPSLSVNPSLTDEPLYYPPAPANGYKVPFTYDVPQPPACPTAQSRNLVLT